MKRLTKLRGTLERREFRAALISVLIPFVVFFVFVYFPQLMNVYLSFTDWNGYSSSFDFVGLANYAKFFTYEPMIGAGSGYGSAPGQRRPDNGAEPNVT